MTRNAESMAALFEAAKHMTVDNNGNYCPENCRWATPLVQANNTRRNRYVSIGTETHSVSEWARIANVHKNTIYHRLNTGKTGRKAVYG